MLALLLDSFIGEAECLVCRRDRHGCALNFRREHGCTCGVLRLARGAARSLALELQRQLGAVLRELGIRRTVLQCCGTIHVVSPRVLGQINALLRKHTLRDLELLLRRRERHTLSREAFRERGSLHALHLKCVRCRAVIGESKQESIGTHLGVRLR